MSKLVKSLGFFIISIFLVSIPLLTGKRWGMLGEPDFFVFFGCVLSMMEIECLTLLFFRRYDI